MTVAVANAPPPRHPLRHFHHGVLRKRFQSGANEPQHTVVLTLFRQAAPALHNVQTRLVY